MVRVEGNIIGVQNRVLTQPSQSQHRRLSIFTDTTLSNCTRAICPTSYNKIGSINVDTSEFM